MGTVIKDTSIVFYYFGMGHGFYVTTIPSSFSSPMLGRIWDRREGKGAAGKTKGGLRG